MSPQSNPSAGRLPPPPHSPSDVVVRQAPKEAMTIAGNLAFDEDAVIDYPAGSKFRLQYDGGKATLNGDSRAGSIDAGDVDVLARRDGVLVFNHRLLIKFGTYPLIASFEGMVDLAPLIGDASVSSYNAEDAVYRAFVRGTGKTVPRLAMVFSARFEGSQGLPKSDDNSWARGAVEEAVRDSAQYISLLRNSFIATATIEVSQGPFYPPSSIAIRVYNSNEISEGVKA